MPTPSSPFCSQSSVAAPDVLDARIEAFLDTVPELLLEISESDFTDYRQVSMRRNNELNV